MATTRDSAEPAEPSGAGGILSRRGVGTLGAGAGFAAAGAGGGVAPVAARFVAWVVADGLDFAAAPGFAAAGAAFAGAGAGFAAAGAGLAGSGSSLAAVAWRAPALVRAPDPSSGCFGGLPPGSSLISSISASASRPARAAAGHDLLVPAYSERARQR
ncbi:MAG: hypothetical protein ABSC46_11015 [Candidatus Limnocylindrales bacterium]